MKDKHDKHDKQDMQEKQEHPTGVPANEKAQVLETQPKTTDTNSPRTRSQPEQVKVWEEEGGSPPEQISSTKSVKPKTESKTGSMGAAKD